MKPRAKVSANLLLAMTGLLAVFLASPAAAAPAKLAAETYEARFERARSLAQAGSHDAALKIYSELIKANPRDADALLGRGRVYAWKQMWAEAERDLAEAQKAAPQYADVYSALADLYAWSGRNDEAAGVVNRWIGILPMDAKAFLRRAALNRDARRFPEAREDLRQARDLKGDPDSIAKLLRDLDRIPAARPWELSAGFEHSSFPYNREEWIGLSASVKREHRFGSTMLESLRARRFSQWDRAAALDNYINLWRRAYVNARIQAGFDSKFFPKTDALAELFQGFGPGMELSASYKYSGYVNDNSDQYGAGLGAYIGRFYVRAKSVFIPANGGSAYSQQFLSRAYLKTVDDFIELSGGFGKDVLLVGSAAGPAPQDRAIAFIGGRVQKFVRPWIGASLSGSYQDYEGLPPERNVKIQLIVRP